MDLQERLNQKGLRLTHPRKVVMSILEAAQVPLSPQSIYQRAVDGEEDIGLVSVYRTLDLLTELALVRRVHGRDDCHGYVLASPGHHHHLVCRECERAIEFTGGDDLSALLERIQSQTGFQVDGHLLQLYGLCPECQNHQNKEEKHVKKP
jgi:Fur family ferric uptake transcriptional regulator